MKAGEADKLFGSVTSMDIEKYLKEEGLEIDRKKILLKEPIKSLGVYTVSIKLHPEVMANMKVWVVKA
jgi:large subunit ribosomal protein L9